MKQVVLASILMIMLVTSAYAQQPAPQAASVLAIQGVPMLQRAGWTSMATLSVGTLVRDIDTIILAPGQQVTLLCGNGSTITLHTFPASPQCTSTNAWNVSFGGAVITGGQRAPQDRYAQLPYLITPRNTRIFYSDSLAFDWADLDGAARYVLRVLNSDGEQVLEAESRRSEWLYTQDPPLEPGSYTVAITAFDRQNQALNIPPDPGIHAQTGGIYFTLLDTTTAEAIATGAATVQAVNLPEDAIIGIADYELGLYYAGQQMYASAIAVLTDILPVDVVAGVPLPKTLSPDVMASQPSLYLLLGNVYQLIGLPVEAYRVYAAGLDVAERMADTTNAAELHIALARTAPERELAIAHYEAALQFFDAVGDTAQVAVLRGELAEYQ